MEKILESLKEILNSEAKILIESEEDVLKIESKDKNYQKKFIDERFNKIKLLIDSIQEKDDKFYVNLIDIVSDYIDQLYNRKIEFLNVSIFDKSDKDVFLDTITFNSWDTFELEKLNQELSENLFNYVCDLLEVNKDIILDIETLKRLLNRNPRLFTLSVEESYISRPFDFGRLVKILNNNQTLKKSSINIDEIYQLLYDTFQLDNSEVFANIIKAKDFKENHVKIDEILMKCNGRTFVNVTKIIINNFDKDFDRFSFIKKRNENGFIERVIIEILQSHHTENDILLIHNILTDKEILIDYNYYYADYTGQSDLKSIIAQSGKRIIINDLLSRKENIQNYYFHGDFIVSLYNLYAIIGNYEKALETFKINYNYEGDYTEDFNDDFNRLGYTRGYFTYRDSIVEFISNMVKSLQEDNIDYLKIKELINKILINDKVKYINLEETFKYIVDLLLDEDLQNLIDNLMQEHNNHNLDFLLVNEENKSFYEWYLIRVATEEEIQESLSIINNKRKKLLKIKKGDN